MSHGSRGAQRLNVPPHVHIRHVLEDWAAHTPDAPALLASGRKPLTYDRLYRHIDGVAQRLRVLGVDCEDRVALLVPTGPEMAVAFLAVAAGAVCAPLNPAYNTNELDSYLAEIDAKALIVQAGMETPVRGVAKARGIKTIELSPVLDAETGLFTLTGEERLHAGRHGFTQPHDVALVLPTSGTTSRPKVVPLTHINICTVAHNIRVTLELFEGDCCLNVLPPFHVHALLVALLASLVAGASCVCNSGFSPTTFFASMAEFRPTWYTAVPTVHQAVLASAVQHREAIRRCSLRFIRSASAPLPRPVLVELERVFKAPVIEAYGMTETAAQITSNPLPPRVRKPGSVGVAAGPEVAIMNPEGAFLPTGESGEIVVRGPIVFQGYENNPTDNKSAFTNGWFRTGDQGFWDSDGYLFITGRLREIINCGGEKIAPQEVDNVLMEHPAIAKAVTFAIPHPRLGEDVAAAVVLRQNTVATEHNIRLFAATRLATFKVPSQVYIVEGLPTSHSGKLQRIDLMAKLGLSVPGRAQLVPHNGHSSPRTPLEEVLLGVWREVLGLDDVSIHDDFFRLGGDSLLATQIISRIREVLHVELSFHRFFEAPTVARMARSIEVVKQAASNRQKLPLQPEARQDTLPLSYSQLSLWFLEQLIPKPAVYHLPLAWRFSGNLNLTALEQSLDEIVRRHEILRTIFRSVDGQPVQVIVPDHSLSLPVVDHQFLSAAERYAAVQCYATEEGRRPFDLDNGPLIRVTILRFGPEDHVLFLVLHHIIFDGWSLEIFWRELMTFYSSICNGQPVSLPELPIQYADFAVWQRQWLQGETLTAQLAYWQRQLGTTLPILDLPTDRPRPPVQSFHGAQQSLTLPESLSAGLKALSQQEGVTLFMTLAAAFQTLLFRYTGQTDVVVGTPMAGRTRVETENLLGFFINTVVLRTDLGGSARFRELLRRVRDVTLGAYDHQDLPFEKLVEAIQPDRDPGRNPLFQVMVAFQQTLPKAEELPGLTIHPVAIERDTAMFDLTLSFQDMGQDLRATVEYATDLFDTTTIARMLEHFQVLLEGIVTNPEQRIAELPLLTTAELQQVTVGWNGPPADYPKNTCIHQLFEAQVERVSGAMAVSCGAKQLPYDTLNRRANQLAHYLRALGVGPEICVGLCVERSLEMIVGLLGILKAGGAYVPIDPSYPPERLAFMMTDAQVPVIVTQQQHIARFPYTRAHVICLDTDWESIAQQREDNLVSEVTPDNLAYVMYTSGSTGKPKGVMIEHRQVVAFLQGFEHVAPHGEICNGTSVCPFSFDVSVWEFFSTLCHGGTLHIILPDVLRDSEHLVQYLSEHQITSAYIPPALLSGVADQLEQLDHQLVLDRILVGVEPIKQGVLQRFRDFSAQMRIVNGYGPTETTICATLFPFDVATDLERRTPIGKRIPGYELYVVDAYMQPVPIGVTGELLIGGDGLARGYLNRPELNAEMFIPHPFRAEPGARLYKTGDRVRYLSDGNLEFSGRHDQQVKHRGYRIELGEIEAALGQHPNIREAVVALQQDEGLDVTRLTAYCAPIQQPAPLPFDLRRFLKQKLPDYMIPSRFLLLDGLPLTPNGKVDRHALPSPGSQDDMPVALYVAPQDATQQILADIWGKVLGLERIGIHDNFFDLGGDSILSIQIIARANQAGLRLTPKQLFEHQTIFDLAAVAGMTSIIRAEQGLVLGCVNLTPIQRWFFEQAFPEAHHWNQSVLLDVPPSLDLSRLECIVSHLLDQHDMLRARFACEASVWRQYIVDVEQSPIVSEQDLSTLPEGEQAETVANITRQYQSRLDLLAGPLMRVVLFRLGPHRPNRLLIIVHHLVIDYVSWPILLEDLQTAYGQLSSGQAIQLPSKTTSFQAWARQLVAYAQSDVLREELPFWLAAAQHQASRLPRDHPGGQNTVASTCIVSVSLSRKDTGALLHEAHQAYGTQINDFLITALGEIFAIWTKSSLVLFDLEGHGREDILEDVDVSRTVGWFTTVYPVWLRLEQTLTLADRLKTVKEQLRCIPNHGIGYGLLRYLCQDDVVVERLWSLPRAEVCFNYLGQFDKGLTEDALFRPRHQVIGSQRSRQGQRCYLLEVNGRIVDGTLRLDWTYSEQIHRRDTVERLACDVMGALQVLIAHCLSPEAGGYTPSDFPGMNLSQHELDDLIDALDQTGEGR